MTLARVVKGTSICVLVCVLALVVWSYASAREYGRFPLHHPWPAVSLVGGAASLTLFGTGTEVRSFLILRFVSALLILVGATVYLWSLL